MEFPETFYLSPIISFRFRICVRCEPGVVLAEVGLADDEAQLQNVADKKPLSILSFPKAYDGWGYTGSRFQGPSGAFSITGAKSYEEHLGLSRQIPPPVGNGFRVLPEGAREPVRFISERGAGTIKAPRRK